MRLTRSVLLSVALAAACADPGADAPGETLARFIDLMDRGGTGALQEAYGLLERAAQGELRRRARKAETLSGRSYAPWEMLAKGRFRLRFAPEAGAMHVRFQGDQRAFVTVVGDGQRVEVPLVSQGGRWRVVLALPQEQP
ncbi:MAG: hypothetical protein OXU20_12760 [Myxococcales bacterium]|nr:hypothetical protein [Myxococcales bacterium]MDD9968904.1 hypothetical protein [Myxococcales bacterium]